MSNMTIDVKVFEQKTNFNDYLGFNSPTQNHQTANCNPASNCGNNVTANSDVSLNVYTSDSAFANINNLYGQTVQTPPVVENYGGFQFKNSNEQTAVDQALVNLRAQQAANPGKEVSQKIKVGKYKLTINLNADGSVNIGRKKKGGFLGGLFKGIGNILKKALPIVSMVAMFVPGLQPLALAARVASGVMGVVDGIKNGNIFGALTSAVGAFSGVGGKVGSFFSNLGSKASGFLSNLGGSMGNWASNAFNSVSSVVSRAKDLWSGFTGSVGSRVSNFLFNSGSNLFKNGLTQFGSNALRTFADTMGNRAIGWLNQKAGSVLNRVMDNPLGQRIGNFLNSGWGQFLTNIFKGRQA